ncbi:MAG: hypothetical protein JSR19_01235 [Proteobacteria bacterium]|nr:hypothetical protein [Pseudomonadota bacterium]HQR03062.1 hypothetical protein [Rhodocyclaceae bacterium]
MTTQDDGKGVFGITVEDLRRTAKPKNPSAGGERDDYSGPFDPHLDVERDLSKTAHIQLWKVATKMYLNIDAAWRGAVETKFGQEASLELSRKVWFEVPNNGCFVESTLPRLAMNISGTTVEDWMKHLQIDPGLMGIAGVSCHMEDENTGVLTVNRCDILDALEQAGDETVQKHVCEELEWVGLQAGVDHMNRNIKVTPLKLPKFGCRDGGCVCQWQFKLQPPGSEGAS